MNHFLNFGILFCMFLPFINDKNNQSETITIRDVESLHELYELKENSLQKDSIQTLVLELDAKIAENE